MSPDFVLETRSLTKTYGPITAVEDLSLGIPAGEVFGLLGPNGSGKTTTISMLLGLVRPSSGSISLFGNDAGPTKEALRRVGAIVESPAFYPYLSGRDNLRYFQGISRRGAESEVNQLLELVELSGRRDSAYQTYSLGMKQRLGIAYSMLGQPDLVFLDEPTNGLDPAGVVEVRGLIKRLSAGGRTIVLSSHLLHEVEQVCENVAIIDHGRLVTQGKVETLLRRPDVLRLETTDNARAMEILRASDRVTGLRLEGTTVLVEVPFERASEVSRNLAAAGVYLQLMERLQVSLESFFLEVTRTPETQEPSEAAS